jgi:hypothetical protein
VGLDQQGRGEPADLGPHAFDLPTRVARSVRGASMSGLIAATGTDRALPGARRSARGVRRVGLDQLSPLARGVGSAEPLGAFTPSDHVLADRVPTRDSRPAVTRCSTSLHFSLRSPPRCSTRQNRRRWPRRLYRTRASPSHRTAGGSMRRSHAVSHTLRECLRRDATAEPRPQRAVTQLGAGAPPRTRRRCITGPCPRRRCRPCSRWPRPACTLSTRGSASASRFRSRV